MSNLVKGMYAHTVGERQKEFMQCRMSIHKDFVKWFEANSHLLDDKGYMHVDIKKSKNDRDKLYAQANDYFSTGDKKAVTHKEHSPDRDAPFK